VVAPTWQDQLPGLLAACDPVWDRLPTTWEEGPYLGNGLVGSMIWCSGDGRRLHWLLGRSDVGKLDYPGRFLDGNRIDIGTLDLVFAEEDRITAFAARIDCYQASVAIELQTLVGRLALRSWAPPGCAWVVDSTVTAGEPCWSWESGLLPTAADHSDGRRRRLVVEDRVWHERSPVASGGCAVVWEERRSDTLHRRCVIAIGGSLVTRACWNDRDDGRSAIDEADAMLDAVWQDPDGLLARHHAWWRRFHGCSAIALADRELLAYYWLQRYTLGSTARRETPPIDNHGVWSTEGVYGFSTWDFNIQITYLLPLATGHPDLVEPLYRFLRTSFPAEITWQEAVGEHRAGIRQQNFLRFRMWDPVHWEHDPGTPCDGPCKFLWALHVIFRWQARSGDEVVANDLIRWLDAGTNAAFAGMTREVDGRWHIAHGGSWECWHGRDPNGLLAIIRWALERLLGLCDLHAPDHPRRRIWQDRLWNLAAYAVDERDGYLLGVEGRVIPHRHWTHLLLHFPLDIVPLDEDRDRRHLVRAIRHWTYLSAGGIDTPPEAGFAPLAAAVLHAWLQVHDDTDWREEIARLMEVFQTGRAEWGPCVWPNTMYREWGPVRETPLFAALVLHECALQDRHDGLHVFPAWPASWGAVDLRGLPAAAGVRVDAHHDGRALRWCRLHCDRAWQGTVHLGRPISANLGTDGATIAPLPERPGSFRVACPAGGGIGFTADRTVPAPHVLVAPAAVHAQAPFGMNDAFYARRAYYEHAKRPLSLRGVTPTWE